MKIYFTTEDMVSFLEWYDNKSEKNLHRTYEEELADWISTQTAE